MSTDKRALPVYALTQQSLTLSIGRSESGYYYGRNPFRALPVLDCTAAHSLACAATPTQAGLLELVQTRYASPSSVGRTPVGPTEADVLGKRAEHINLFNSSPLGKFYHVPFHAA